MEIYLAYEEHVQQSFQWRKPCNATLKGKRQQLDIIHTFWVLNKCTNTIYKLQNDQLGKWP